MKNIYIAHSTSFEYKRNLYNPIKEIVSSGVEFIFPHENNNEGEDSSKVIAKCDIFIGEVSHPSLGLGIEIGRAEAAGIPIVFLYKKGVKISSSLKFVSDSFFEYETEKELKDIIKKLVAKI